MNISDSFIPEMNEINLKNKSIEQIPKLLIPSINETESDDDEYEFVDDPKMNEFKNEEAIGGNISISSGDDDEIEETEVLDESDDEYEFADNGK